MDATRAPHHRKPRMGVLLVNLGSPQAPTPGAIRRYLAQPRLRLAWAIASSARNPDLSRVR